MKKHVIMNGLFLFIALAYVAGCQDEATKPAVQSPVADFSATPLVGSTPLTVQFTDHSTGEINTRTWQFGDQTQSSEQNPLHVYSQEGTYTVSLTVVGPGGQKTKTKPSYITCTKGTPPPSADFSATPLVGSTPLTVQFTNHSTGEINTRTWQFGDQTQSSEQNPLHVYSQEGTYTVSLTVVGPGGQDMKTMSDYIGCTSSFPIVYMTYTTGRMYYAMRQNNTWTEEEIPYESGRFPLLALDDQGYVHISYSDYDLQRLGWDLKYAVRTLDGSWSISTLAGGQDNYNHFLVVDAVHRSSHVLYVTYQKADSTHHLRYAEWLRKTGGGWTGSEVEVGAPFLYPYGLAVDALGDPHISYVSEDGPHQQSKYAVKHGGVWFIEAVGGQELQAGELAFDAQHNPNMAYASEYGLYLSVKGAVGWQGEQVDTDCAWVLGFVIDGQDAPHILYVSKNRDRNKYAVRRNGVWTIEEFDRLLSVGGLAVDALGNPHMFYKGAAGLDLYYTVKVGGHWFTEKLPRHEIESGSIAVGR